jgi:hypothetical protein
MFNFNDLGLQSTSSVYSTPVLFKTCYHKFYKLRQRKKKARSYRFNEAELRLTEKEEPRPTAQPQNQTAVQTYSSISKHKTLSLDIHEEITFTTQRKHREGTVRRSCLIFVEHLHRLGYQRIPLEEAKNIFSQLLDKWDRLTLKAYFGTQEGTSERNIDRTAHYASGTVSFKTIRLKQKIKRCVGYFERLGLASYEKHGSLWFMLLNPCSVVPEMAPSSTSVSEGCVGSITNLSLTPKHVGEQVGGSLRRRRNGTLVDNLETRERESVIGREIKSLERIQNCIHNQDDKVSFGSDLSPLEQAILNAKPCVQKDRAKIQWSGGSAHG